MFFVPIEFRFALSKYFDGFFSFQYTRKVSLHILFKILFLKNQHISVKLAVKPQAT